MSVMELPPDTRRSRATSNSLLRSDICSGTEFRFLFAFVGGVLPRLEPPGVPPTRDTADSGGGGDMPPGTPCSGATSSSMVALISVLRSSMNRYSSSR
eukprot:scaffold7520_cov229-Pinguiococcus_pyrenoidosus.AAC.3